VSLLARLFCSHKWDTVSEFTSKSALEVTKGEVDFMVPCILRPLTEKKHVLILKCDLCGAVKKIETEIPA
jgi:hypothetical protein